MYDVKMLGYRSQYVNYSVDTHIAHDNVVPTTLLFAERRGTIVNDARKCIVAGAAKALFARILSRARVQTHCIFIVYMLAKVCQKVARK